MPQVAYVLLVDAMNPGNWLPATDSAETRFILRPQLLTYSSKVIPILEWLGMQPCAIWDLFLFGLYVTGLLEGKLNILGE